MSAARAESGRSGIDEARAAAAIRELLIAVGEDADRPGLVDTPARVARAYAEAGGHYSALAPAALRAQAATDAAEFAADLTRGSIDREAVRAMVVATGGGAAVADDINRMAIALERLFAAFVRERLAAEPTLADDLVRRSRNVNASFRTAVMAARLIGVSRASSLR